MFGMATTVSRTSYHIDIGHSIRFLPVTTDFLDLTPEGPILQLIEAEFPDQAPVRMDAGAVPNPFKGIHPVSSRHFPQSR